MKEKIAAHKNWFIIGIVVVILLIACIWWFSGYGGWQCFIYGTILDVGDDSFVLRNKFNDEKHIEFYVVTMAEDPVKYDGIRIADINGNEISFSDLEPGMQVSVNTHVYTRDIHSETFFEAGIYATAVAVVG